MHREASSARAAVLGLCGALVSVGCSPAMPASLRHPLVGAEAPQFEVESTGARPVRVPGGPRTKVTVVDFWATWCAACKTTIPALDAIWRDHKEDGVMVIGVSIDEIAELADAAAQALGASFPIVSDPFLELAGSYGVAQVPLTFVVDRGGVVRWVGHDPASARRAVDAVLSEGGSGARPRSAFE